jgi:hypothetical protein
MTEAEKKRLRRKAHAALQRARIARKRRLLLDTIDRG